MASLLFACELGEGLGHLNRLIAVARPFAAHDLAFAVQGPLQEAALRAALGGAVRVFRSPAARPSPGRADDPAPDRTLADILRRTGLDDRAGVSAAVVVWLAILGEVRPRAVVSDYAPTLRVAAAGRVPHMVLGNGFTVPPSLSPLPAFAGADPPGERSRAAEAAVLDCLNAARADHATLPLGRLADALEGDATFVSTYPFFDPYAALRDTPPLQPFNLPAIAPGPPVAERAGPDVFAYLDGHYSGLGLVLDALNGLGRGAELFVRHAEPADLARRCAPNVRVYNAPADLARVLPRTKLLVHHGGPATGLAGLLAGAPQLLLPRHTEQLLNAQGLATLGTSVGIGLKANAAAAGLPRMMERLLGGGAVGRRAFEVARELATTRVATAERPAIEALEAMIASGAGSARAPRTPEARKDALMAADRDRPPGRPARSYLICSSPRVGSNLVCDALGACEGGGAPAEYFNERSIGAYLRRIGAASLPPADYIDHLFAHRRDGAGVLGLKVHHHQLARMFPSAEDRRAFLRRFDAVLFLRRRNKVRQAISEARARASAVWYAEDVRHAEAARAASSTYDASAIAACLASVMADDGGWEAVLHAAQVPHATAFYEDVVADFPRSLEAIGAHLGLDLQASRFVAPSTHRLGDDLNAAWERRFRDEVLGAGDQPSGCIPGRSGP